MVYKNDDLTDKKDWILANKNNGNGVKRAPPISDWKLKERYRPQLVVNENKIETVIPAVKYTDNPFSLTNWWFLLKSHNCDQIN